MPIFDHFSFIAPLYDRIIPLRNEERVIEIVGLPVEGALLDAGGGTGRVAQAVAAYAQQVIVSDLSLGMLRQARVKDNLQLACSRTEYLPFQDGAFERVIMVDALHHVYDHVLTARELWRVLKPGGRLVIEEPDIRQFGVKLVALGEKIMLMRSHFNKPQEIADLFNYPNARVELIPDGFNIWTIVDKE